MKKAIRIIALALAIIQVLVLALVLLPIGAAAKSSVSEFDPNKLTELYLLDVTPYAQNNNNGKFNTCGPSSALAIRNYLSNENPILPSSKKDIQMYYYKYPLWAAVSFLNKEVGGYKYTYCDMQTFIDLVKQSLATWNPVMVLINYDKSTNFKRYWNFKGKVLSHFSVIDGLLQDKNGDYYFRFCDSYVNRLDATDYANPKTARVYVPAKDLFKLMINQNIDDGKEPQPNSQKPYLLAYSTSNRSSKSIYKQTAKSEKTLVTLPVNTVVYKEPALISKASVAKSAGIALITERGFNGSSEVVRLSTGYYYKVTSCLKPIKPSIAVRGKAYTLSPSLIKSRNKTGVTVTFSGANVSKVRVEVLRNGKILTCYYNGQKKTSDFYVTTNRVSFQVDGIYGEIKVRITPIYTIDKYEISGASTTVKIK